MERCLTAQGFIDMIYVEDRLIPEKVDIHATLPRHLLIVDITSGGYMKTCTKCNTPKPESEFYNQKQAKDGLYSYCKACCQEARDKYTPEYKAYCSMHARCRPGRTDHKNYYDKGIRVCDYWHSYENFLADMGPKPTPKHQIDRADSEADYSPDNCRWVTHLENIRSKKSLKMSIEKARRVRELVSNGMSRADVAKIYDVSSATISGITRNLIWKEEGSVAMMGKPGRRTCTVSTFDNQSGE